MYTITIRWRKSSTATVWYANICVMVYVSLGAYALRTTSTGNVNDTHCARSANPSGITVKSLSMAKQVSLKIDSMHSGPLLRLIFAPIHSLNSLVALLLHTTWTCVRTHTSSKPNTKTNRSDYFEINFASIYNFTIFQYFHYLASDWRRDKSHEFVQIIINYVYVFFSPSSDRSWSPLVRHAWVHGLRNIPSKFYPIVTS